MGGELFSTTGGINFRGRYVINNTNYHFFKVSLDNIPLLNIFKLTIRFL